VATTVATAVIVNTTADMAAVGGDRIEVPITRRTMAAVRAAAARMDIRPPVMAGAVATAATIRVVAATVAAIRAAEVDADRVAAAMVDAIRAAADMMVTIRPADAEGARIVEEW
jgi:hypothetical protein